jgi:hypothetical protein
MVYSDAFSSLPARVRRAVMERLEQALCTGDTEIAPHLRDSEKERITAILKKTLPEKSGRE